MPSEPARNRLHDSLFELYIDGGLELFQAGTRGLKRDLIFKLETSALTPEKGEIVHYYVVNRWDEEGEFNVVEIVSLHTRPGLRDPFAPLEADLRGPQPRSSLH